MGTAVEIERTVNAAMERTSRDLIAVGEETLPDYVRWDLPDVVSYLAVLLDAAFLSGATWSHVQASRTLGVKVDPWTPTVPGSKAGE